MTARASFLASKKEKHLSRLEVDLSPEPTTLTEKAHALLPGKIKSVPTLRYKEGKLEVTGVPLIKATLVDCSTYLWRDGTSSPSVMYGLMASAILPQTNSRSAKSGGFSDPSILCSKRANVLYRSGSIFYCFRSLRRIRPQKKSERRNERCATWSGFTKAHRKCSSWIVASSRLRPTTWARRRSTHVLYMFTTPVDPARRLR